MVLTRVWTKQAQCRSAKSTSTPEPTLSTRLPESLSRLTPSAKNCSLFSLPKTEHLCLQLDLPHPATSDAATGSHGIPSLPSVVSLIFCCRRRRKRPHRRTLVLLILDQEALRCFQRRHHVLSLDGYSYNKACRRTRVQPGDHGLHRRRRCKGQDLPVHACCRGWSATTRPA